MHVTVICLVSVGSEQSLVVVCIYVSGPMDCDGTENFLSPSGFCLDAQLQLFGNCLCNFVGVIDYTTQPGSV